jgi:cytochrome c oxidase cbb3-type subunit 2
VNTNGLVYLTGGSLLSLLLGIIVTIILPAEEPIGPSPTARPYTALEQHGRDVYLREGCQYCHTQQVRAPEADKGMIRRPGDIGPESEPGDYYYQSPVFWGTQRQGPDLSHVAATAPGNSPEWHRVHFRDPRAVSPGSIMPSFDYLSGADTEALIAYMLTLR